MSNWYLDTQLLAPLLFPGSVPPRVGVGSGGPVPVSLQPSQLAIAAAAAAQVGLAGAPHVGVHSSTSSHLLTGQPGGAPLQSAGASGQNGIPCGPSPSAGSKPGAQGPSSFHEQFKQVR